MLEMTCATGRIPAPVASMHRRPQRSTGQGSRNNYRFKTTTIFSPPLYRENLPSSIWKAPKWDKDPSKILLREPSTDDDLPPRRRHRCAFFLSFVHTTCEPIFRHIAIINYMSFNSTFAGCVVVPVGWMEEDQEYSLQGQDNPPWLQPGKINSFVFTSSPTCLQNS